MRDPLDHITERFTALVERVKAYRDLPCVCDHSSVEAEEESLAMCAPCHVDSLFDETLEHAEGVVEYIDRMAEDRARVRPSNASKVARRDNVVRFQPASTAKQPNAVWKC